MALAVRNTPFAALIGFVGVTPLWWAEVELSPLRNVILAPLFPYLRGKDGVGVLIGIADSALLATVLAAVGILLVFLTRSNPSCLRNATWCLPVLSVGLSVSTVCFGRFESVVAVPVQVTTLFLTVGIFSYTFLTSQRRAVPVR
jgi:hypothetical protein